MTARTRRTLGMTLTGLYLIIYISIATTIGGAFAERSPLDQIIFFGIAGVIWVLPLYPLFKWMRKPDAHELPAENAPSISKPVRKRG
jgi:hypothetical protein